MVKNEKNEELQSRREFFKKAAKGALPILGAVVLASAPGLANAAESAVEMGCSTNCNVRCSGCGTACFKGCSNVQTFLLICTCQLNLRFPNKMSMVKS